MTKHDPKLAQLIVREQMDALFKGRHFSICAVDEMSKILQVNAEAHPTYELLHALHCRHYSDMSPEMKRKLPAMVMDVLTPVIDFDSDVAASLLTGHVPEHSALLEHDSPPTPNYIPAEEYDTPFGKIQNKLRRLLPGGSE